jgi:hypothetical protein
MPSTAEYARIRNTGIKRVWIGDWTLTNHAGARYTIPGRYLCAGCAVNVKTGIGSHTKAALYWGRTKPARVDNGDLATLQTKSGSVVDRCGWNGFWQGPGIPPPPAIDAMNLC